MISMSTHMVDEGFHPTTISIFTQMVNEGFHLLLSRTTAAETLCKESQTCVCLYAENVDEGLHTKVSVKIYGLSLQMP